MRFKNKIVYGILGVLGFIPIFMLVIIQSIFALEAAYDSKLVIDAEETTIAAIIMYDAYNNQITDFPNYEDGKPILISIIEATDEYVLLDLHGGKANNTRIEISGMQFELEDGTKTKLVSGVVYIVYKNVDMTQNTWLTDFIEDTNQLYNTYYKQPQGTVSFVWVKIITASIGTLIGLGLVLLVVLRKSTKELVKRYWRISVLVAFINATMILGFISWLITDIFQVFAAATVGWMIFLGAEKLAKIKGYIETASITGELPSELPATAKVEIEAQISNILAKYRK